MVLNIGENDSIRIVKQYSDAESMVESFEFADGTAAHIDLETSEFVIDTEGTSIIQTNAEVLSNLYTEAASSENELSAEALKAVNSVDNDSILSEYSSNETVSDMTDIQTMILAEKMAGFVAEDSISDSINIMNDNGLLATDQLLADTSAK